MSAFQSTQLLISSKQFTDVRERTLTTLDVPLAYYTESTLAATVSSVNEGHYCFLSDYSVLGV